MLWPRWIWLRALGLIFFSAFYSLWFQIVALNGPRGVLPAAEYLPALRAAVGLLKAAWFAPTLFWFASGDAALKAVVAAGAVASVLLTLNLAPRAMIAVSGICFLSFIGAAQDFASYQSDGMLLEAAFLSLFLAPRGLRPGLGASDPPAKLAVFMLLWEWFRIYFESGVVKLLSGDVQWKTLTAMDHYYENGPLPSWVGWYVQEELPHAFHAFTVVLVFFVELVLVWLAFLPRPFRRACFFVVSPFQAAIILTANYAFLNYLVLALGFLLLDDRVVEWVLPSRVRALIAPAPAAQTGVGSPLAAWREAWEKFAKPVGMTLAGICLGTVFYVATIQLVWMFVPEFPFPTAPAQMIEPFRIANLYGLFEVMTHERYEIEFQGSIDGKTWTPYPFRYKPQDVKTPPGIYAPYQPRFDWNLWFASLGSWQQYKFVVWTELRLLQNSRDVLQLFAGNPFAAAPPKEVRVVIYQYWFTDLKTKREQGTWWRRQLLGEYAPGVEMQPNGKPALVDVPLANPAEP